MSTPRARQRRALLLLAALATACAPRETPPQPPRSEDARTTRAATDDGEAAPAPTVTSTGDAAGPPRFTDVSDAAGLAVRHEAGRRGAFELPEIMGSGAALLDCDGDGDLDALLVAGAPRPGGRHHLLRQRGDGTFADHSDAAGLVQSGHGMGVAVGDVDADGDVDVLVTHANGSALYRNDGDCSFTDVTAAAGLEPSGWATSAAFLDHDRDGDLDLFVTRYVVADPAVRCESSTGGRDYCSPSAYEPTSDRLLRNDGAGSFTDVSKESGIASARGPGLGVAVIDLDDDGWDDVLVANDGAANFAWINRGDGTFLERAVALGLAHDANGHVEAGMGVALGDLDRDGTDEIVMTHLRWETNTLYRRGQAGTWHDATRGSGLGPPSHARTGFGAVALDAEHDGDLDLAVVNGSVTRGASSPCRSDPSDFAACHGEPDQLFVNEGDGRFGALPLAPRESPGSSRALAVGDVDADGDLDLLATDADGAARLLRNDSPKRGHFVVVRAMARGVDALGATVTIHAGGEALARRVRADGSYLSSRDPAAHFGLGPLARIDRVEVRWPDGVAESFGSVDADRRHLLHRGAGQRIADAP